MGEGPAGRPGSPSAAASSAVNSSRSSSTPLMATISNCLPARRTASPKSESIRLRRSRDQSSLVGHERAGRNSRRIGIAMPSPWDHRRFINAGGQYSQLVCIGVGKRRWYATILSFDRPRSRSVSTERHGRSLSRAGFTLRSSARPWPLPWQSLIFTHASSVFIPTAPHISRLCSAVYDNTHRLLRCHYL